MAAVVDRMHHDIEIMTRRLELEKRRLQKLDKELQAAHETYRKKTAGAGGSLRPKSQDLGFRPPEAGQFERSKSGCTNGSVTLSTSDRGGPQKSIEGGGSTEPSQHLPMGNAKSIVSRLDVGTQRLNGLWNKNEELRLQINKIRQNRLQLNSIFERMKAEIRQRSMQLADVVEETGAGRGVQGDAEQRIAVMKRQREAERANFKDQVLRIRKDLQEYDFEKKEVEVQLKRAETGVQKKRDLIVPEEESEWSEASMMRRIMKTAFLNCIQRRHIKQHEKTIAVFEQAFATIKHSTGISNIDEIVKIFVSLESRNYSLLTYVNHMNREIEALEGVRRGRVSAELERQNNEQKRESAREAAIGSMRKQLQSKLESTAETREACMEHRELIESLGPLARKLGQRLQEEIEELQGLGNFGGGGGGGGGAGGDELPSLPREWNDESIPEWLEWVERALGRFRDLIPAPDRDQQPFPATAAPRVKQLTPKRMHVNLVPLVKAQELPNAVSVSLDDMPAQKRANVTAMQRAEIVDEEEDEEDFADRPLMLKDLKERAEKSAARRRKRQGRHMNEMAGQMALDASFRSQAGASKPRRLGSTLDDEDEEGEGSADGDEAQARRRRESGGSAFSGAGSSAGDGDNEPASAKERRMSLSAIKRAARSKQLELQLQNAGKAEISEGELEAAFLNRYKMTREELQVMADRMGIHLSNLCFLKQEFDLHDEDQSGYIDSKELGALLNQLGEALNQEELDAAFKDLDQDGSGEIEFFEFVEWFTATD